MSSDSRGWLGMPEHLGLVGPSLIIYDDAGLKARGTGFAERG